jgi:hypothetical protein
LDLTPPSKESIRADLERQVLNALPERQAGRLVRLLARAHFEGIDVEGLIAPAILWVVPYLKYGFTHAIGAIPAWLDLADQADDPSLKLSLLGEIFDHLAYDGTRYPQGPFPFPEGRESYDPVAFYHAVLDEDEATGIALARDFFANDGAIDDLLPVLVDIATEHYFDFGHPLIYLKKIRLLLQRLPQTEGLAEALVFAWIRQTVNATREDVLPDFRHYAKALVEARALPALGEGSEQPKMPRGLSIKLSLEWALEAMSNVKPRVLLEALMHAAADNMLHFEAEHASAWDVGVQHSVGWLDFTHALTMANALGELAGDDSEIWSKGLLQIAMFVGRNAPYVNFDQPVTEWLDLADRDPAASVEAIAMHGMGLNIFACHLAKTYVAVSSDADRAKPETARVMRASVQRLLGTPMLEKNFRRTARQALELVGKDYG